MHLAVMFSLLPSTVAVVVGIPFVLARRVSTVLVYKSQHKHERYLRWKEAEYIHRLGYDWKQAHFWVVTSFRRVYAFGYTAWTASQSVLALVFCFLRGRDGLQADLFFVVCLAFALVQTVKPGFRCWSTNQMFFVASWCAAINGWFGVMRAHGMQSAVVVDSNFFLAMIIVNTTCGLWAAFIFAFTTCFNDKWPIGLVIDGVAANQVMATLAADGDALLPSPPRTSVHVGPKRGEYQDDVPTPSAPPAARIPRISELSVDTLVRAACVPAGLCGCALTALCVCCFSPA